MTDNRRENFLIAVLFLLLVFFLKRSCLGLPTFGDEINYLNGTLAVYKNHLNPFTLFWAYKPPLVYLVDACLYKIFGLSLPVTRLPVFFYSFWTVFFTFLLGEKVYNREVGFGASLLLFFSPVFFTQSGLFSSDILMAALTVSTIYFFLTQGRIKYIISAGLLVLTKELEVLVIVSIGLYQLFFGPPKTARWRGTLFYLIPLLFFIEWMLLNKLVFGWFLYPLWGGLVHQFKFHPDLMSFILKTFFWVHFRFLITVLISGCVLFSLVFKGVFKEQFIKKETALFAILGFLSIAGLGGLTGQNYGYTPRYLLFIYPLFFIMGAACIVLLVKNRIAYIFVFVTILSLFILSWSSYPSWYWYDLNMKYTDMVKSHQQATAYIEKNFPSAMVIAPHPFQNYLTYDIFGYGQRPLPYYHVRSNPMLFIKTQKDIVVLDSKYYANWTPDGLCIEALVQQNGPTLLKKFISEYDEVGIYYFHPGPFTVIPEACHG